MTDWRLALRFAGRELRGGLRGFRIFLACLMLGVAAIAGVGSLAAGVRSALEADARQILGGDVELAFTHRTATEEQLRYITARGSVSVVAQMRGMARTEAARTLVEIKAADSAYPLIGRVTVEGAPSLQEALAQRDGVWGAVVERSALLRLDAKLGDRIAVGDQEYVLRAVVQAEPDRSANVFTLGPRIFVALDSLAGTGLVQPGSLIRNEYRVLLRAGDSPEAFIADLRRVFPDAGWRLRGPGEAAPGVQRWVDRIAMFLTLVGLTALLVGGVGVANAVRSYLDSKRATIATLKCLGAPGGFVLTLYLALVMVMAAFGVTAGLIIGAAAPFILGPLLAGQLPVTAQGGLYLQPLLVAAAFGGLTTIAFSLWPLARAREVPPSALFRDLVAPTRRWPRLGAMLVVAVAVAGLSALAIWTSVDRKLAAWFVAASFGTFVLFRGAALLIAALARRAPHTGRPGLRLALANLHRPGSPAGGLVLSLGLGLTVLVVIALLQGNLTRQLREQLPEMAPSFFFIDIQSDQVAEFDALMASQPGVGQVRRVPSLRGRIARLNGVAVEVADIAPEARWAVGSDRGLTYSAAPPPGTRIVAGEWWPPNYSGPPLVSFDAQLANGMGLRIGDAITLNVLGREIDVRIGNLRAIDWTTIGINFTLVFAPGTLEGAPQTHIATAQVSPEAEDAVERAVTQRFANVSTIRIKDALATVDRMLGQIGTAARLTAGITLLAGTLVLAGAVFATHRRRVYDAVVLKVLGARRGNVIGAFAIEFGLVGLSTAIVAAIVGSLAAWLLMRFYMRLEFTLLPGTVAATAAGAALAVMILGLAGTWRALGHKAAPLLRNP